MGEYSSTQAQHHQQQQHQTTKTSTKIGTARNENRNTMTQHRAGMLDLKCVVTDSFSCGWLSFLRGWVEQEKEIKRGGGGVRV